jgi:polar amino acid transport system substrate-binding protein
MSKDKSIHGNEPLTSSGERLRLVIEASPSGMIMVDDQGKMVLINSQVQKLFGYDRDELLGQPIEILVPQSARSKHPGYRDAFFQEPTSRAMGAGRDLFGLRKDGSQIPVEIGLNPLETEGRQYVLASIVDITERKRAEDKLRAQANLLELTHDTIMVCELDGTIRYWNRGAVDMYGFTEQQAIGHKAYDLLKTEFPIPLTEIKKELLLKGRWDGELTHSTFDGRKIVVASRWALKTDAHGKPCGILEINNDISARKAAEDNLLRANEELELRVQARTSELESLNNELAAARDQAQAASKLKSEFVANMSHEIRTPMNVIIGMCNLMLKTQLDDRQQQCAETIREGANILLTVINDILDFSKIEAGKLELEFVDFDPVRIVESTCELLAPSAHAKHLSLMADIDQSMPELLGGDPERLRQILINLTSNAIKFSDHGEIVVRAEVKSVENNIANIQFSVTDQGIGISEDMQARLFQPFVQVDGSISKRFGGTGLGLSICKRLVELKRGRIGVQSSAGVGSTFWFIVPLELRHHAPVVTLREELRNVKVLIVDDESKAGEILHSYVLSWGMRNGIAASSKDALKLLRQAYIEGDPFKVANIDFVLPDKNGIELAAAISNDAAISNTKLILLAGFDEPGLGTQAISSGFKAYLTKPVRRSHLLEAIITVCGGGESIISRSAADVRLKNTNAKAMRSELILIVEDYPVNQRVARFYLDELGFASDIAGNGNEALLALSKNDYALVLMDCQMPELDGFATTKAIRKDETFTGRHIPIVAMTAHAMGGDREQCLTAGMDDYITKPVDPDQLEKAINSWLPQKTLVVESQADSEAILSEHAATNEPIDLAALYSRFRDGGQELLKLFLEDAFKDLAKLQGIFGKGNRTDFAQVAHGLKGSCGSIFANEMRTTCLALENSARGGDWDTIPGLLQCLEKELAAVEEFIKCKLTKASE